MTKSQTLEAIEKARLSHIGQMEKIDLMLKGVEIENPTSVSKTKCEFGKWLYGNDDDFMANILGLQFYEQLDKEHEAWHTEYAKIYDLLIQKKKKGFFAKVLNKNSVDTLSLDKAKAYYVELEGTTERLLHMLEKSKRRLMAINETKFLKTF
jgi:hypothetical protein